MSESAKYSVSEFAELWGWNEEFVRQMCRQQIDKRTGKRYELPGGWAASKAGRDWEIYRKDRAPAISLGRVAETCATYTSENPAISIEIHLEYQKSDGWTATLVRPKSGKLAQQLRTALKQLSEE